MAGQAIMTTQQLHHANAKASYSIEVDVLNTSITSQYGHAASNLYIDAATDISFGGGGSGGNGYTASNLYIDAARDISFGGGFSGGKVLLPEVRTRYDGSSFADNVTDYTGPD